MFNEIKIDCPCNSKKNLSWTDAWGPVSRLLICSAEIRGGGGGGGGGGDVVRRMGTQQQE